MAADQARPTRGEIWWANLDPVQGHEQEGTRPVLVVSEEALCSALNLVMVVPLTTNQHKLPTRVPIPKGEGGLAEDSMAMTDQLRTIDAGRFTRRSGRTRPTTLGEVESCLRKLLRLPARVVG